MHLSIDISGNNFTFDSSKGVDLSIPITRDGNTLNAYSLPDPNIEPFQVEGFIGSVEDGGPVNCENIFFNAHGNGTHTECVGHISKEKHSIINSISEYFFTSQLITVVPNEVNGDFIIEKSSIEGALQDGIKAIIIRTSPNTNEKFTKRYSGSNPTYLTAELATYLREMGVEHLLVDIPSVDREEDGGALAAHRAFWNYPENPRLNCTITELIFVPNEVKDGVFLLNLMFGGFDSDAAPSKPIIYPIEN